jgi:exodeoxyribonuclease VII large subunit
MQGDIAEESIVSALKDIAQREDEFDVVAIIRGGGSTSDLALFDSYLIASYVAQFPLPIFSGIGHDKDISVVDMVAHTSLKTPTAVATKLVEMADYEMTLVENFASDIAHNVEDMLHSEDMRLYTHGVNISREATRHISNHEKRIELIKDGLLNRVEYMISTEEQRLNAAERTLQSYSLDNILRLGFAVARTQDGALRSIKDVTIGSAMNIELLDGVVGAEIKSITPKN